MVEEIQTISAAERAKQRKELLKAKKEKINQVEKLSIASEKPEKVSKTDQGNKPTPKKKRAVKKTNTATKTHKEIRKESIKELAREIDKTPFQRIQDAGIDDIEVYESDVQAFAAEYVEEKLKGNIPKNDSIWFNGLLEYVRKRTQHPYRGDINQLERSWEVFKSLCTEYNIVPTIFDYGLFVGVSHRVIYEWKNRRDYKVKSNFGYTVTPQHSAFAQKICTECESFLAASVAKNRGADPNRMFILKSVYGYTETAPVQTIQHVTGIKSADNLPTLQDIMSTNNEHTFALDFDENTENTDK